MLSYSRVHHKSELAYVMITCETGCQTTVLESIKELEGIKEIKVTVGNYDMIIKIQSESTEQLRDLISGKIRRIPQILATTTLLCLDSPTSMLMSSTH